MFKVGLTGGIGSGKTTVSNMFEALGVPVIDADVIAKTLIKPDGPGFNEVVKHFGEKILSKTGEINYRLLKKIIFSDPEEKNWLENLLHPMIRAHMKKMAEKLDTPYCIFSVPLLIETGKAHELVDRILVVDAPLEERIKRVMSRDEIDRKTVETIQSTQVSREERLAHANDIITNNGSIKELRQQVEALHRKYSEHSHRAN